MSQQYLGEHPDSMVLYCLIRRPGPDGDEYLIMPKQGYMAFPCTKMRPGEGLYQSLMRPLEQDLGLPPQSYFPESELAMLERNGSSPRYQGLPHKWYLYPVDISLTTEARQILAQGKTGGQWQTLSRLAGADPEPNIGLLCGRLQSMKLGPPHEEPSMEARACHWAAAHDGGVRLVRGADVQNIMQAGDRAFNLRVADPYLPYQRQGLGFTWSFFSAKDKQDIHVHGMPAVEIYGVMQGRMLLWHKPMNQRGARCWRFVLLGPGDWLEVEPLHCHMACWLDADGLGTVFKAAGGGELAGVGKIGQAGKTTCDQCSMSGKCAPHPIMQAIFREQQKEFSQRDFASLKAMAAKLTGAALVEN